MKLQKSRVSDDPAFKRKENNSEAVWKPTQDEAAKEERSCCSYLGSWTFRRSSLEAPEGC